MTRHICLVAVIAVVVLVALPATAQTDALVIDDVDDSGYPNIELTVTVPSTLDAVALPPSAFTVTEDGEVLGRPTLGQSPSTGVASQSPAPRIVLAIDVSGSMRMSSTGGPEPIEQARAAAADFVRELKTGTQVAIVAFGNNPVVVQRFTSDAEALLDRIASIHADESAETALYDGVMQSAQLLAQGRSDVPRSIVLLSDGGDTVSRSDMSAARSELEASGALLWAVGLESSESEPDTLEQLAGSPDRVLSAADADALREIYLGLASSLSRQYLLRYRSASSGDTAVGVALDYGTVRASTSTNVDIEGTPADPADEPPTRVSTTRPQVVIVPPLGTTSAYIAGLAAFGTALGLLVWILGSSPRRSPGSRLLLPVAGGRERPGLTSVAEWMTDQADRQLRNRRLGDSIDRALEEAGLELRTGEFAVLVSSIMIVAYALGFAVANLYLGVLFAFAVPIVARTVLAIRRDRRQTAFAEQFIDVLQLIASSLRAGYGLLQGIDAVARDAQEPATDEFRRILVEHRLGRDLTEAMENCAVRMGNNDFEWVVQAIDIHRDIGGDLARVLDNIVGTVRERTAVHRQVRALSAEGRMSAWVLTALPFVTMAAISIASPGYLGQLTSRPIGLVLLVVAGLMLLFGTIVIRRMVKIRY